MILIRLSMAFVTMLAVGLMPAASLAESSDSAANAIVGQWLVEEDNEPIEIIEIYPCGDEFCGKIVWTALSEGKDQEARDAKNPNKKLRNRLLEGLEVLTGYSYDGENVWHDGELYAHRKGKTVSPKFTLISQDSLKAEVKFLFISKSFIWTRVVGGNKKPD